MAFFTSYLDVCARELEFRRVMIEFRRRLPARLDVAVLALRAQLPVVLVRVAGNALV